MGLKLRLLTTLAVGLGCSPSHEDSLKDIGAITSNYTAFVVYNDDRGFVVLKKCEDIESHPNRACKGYNLRKWKTERYAELLNFSIFLDPAVIKKNRNDYVGEQQKVEHFSTLLKEHQSDYAGQTNELMQEDIRVQRNINELRSIVIDLTSRLASEKGEDLKIAYQSQIEGINNVTIPKLETDSGEIRSQIQQLRSKAKTSEEQVPIVQEQLDTATKRLNGLNAELKAYQEKIQKETVVAAQELLKSLKDGKNIVTYEGEAQFDFAVRPFLYGPLKNIDKKHNWHHVGQFWLYNAGNHNEVAVRFLNYNNAPYMYIAIDGSSNLVGKDVEELSENDGYSGSKRIYKVKYLQGHEINIGVKDRTSSRVNIYIPWFVNIPFDASTKK